MNLQGKVGVITGPSGGIGSTTARRFAEAACAVVVGYNSRAAVTLMTATTGSILLVEGGRLL